ncbi:MAG: hypothetical protein ABIZ09_20175 [Rhodoferax sp.]
MKFHFPVSLALALAAPLGALAAPPQPPQPINPADVQSLRQEIDSMRADYEARLKALEQRLVAAEHQMPVSAPPPPAPAAPVAIQAAPAGGPNAFNPAMSLVLSGQYTGTSVSPGQYAISGFQLPKVSDAGPGARSFNLGESELGMAANIDPWLRGAANISLHGDDTVSVEEAFIQTTSLGNGVGIKAGRFLSGIGYLNSHHAHTWDFADNPLAYQAMLGTQYGDDGLQINWLAPTDQYIELGFELGRGRNFPGSDTGKNGAGMVSFTAHTGGDIGDSNNWRAGVSWLHTDASDQELSALDASNSLVTNAFSGSTQVAILDGIWKWAPHGNATHTNFKLQGEYLQSTRSGSFSYDLAGANSSDAYNAVQSGWYLQGVYQFLPYWRVGLRTEQLDAGSPDYGINAVALAGTGFKPSKQTLMLDFNPSEFSRIRLQFAQDRSRENQTDNQVFLQYQMSLGAHGAHGY